MSQDNNQQSPVFEVDAENLNNGFLNVPQIEDFNEQGLEFDYNQDPDPIVEPQKEEEKDDDGELNNQNTPEDNGSEGEGGESEDNEEGEEGEIPEGDKGTDSEEEDPLEGFSEAAIVAEHLKSINFLDKELEFDKESDYNALVQTLVSQSEKIARQNITTEIAQKGWTEETLQYATFLAQGGNPGAISEIAQFNTLADIDLEGEDSERNQEEVVRAMYKMKGISESKANMFIEALKDEEKLVEESKEATEFFDVQRKEYNKNIQLAAQNRQEQIRQAEEQRITHFTQLIDKGDLGVVSIEEEEKQGLKDALFKKTEIVKVKDPNGGYTTTFVTKFDKLYNELQSNPTQQLVFARMLLNGFDNSDIAKKIEKKTTESMIDLLNRRKQSNKQSKQKPSKSVKNAYLGR